MNQPKLWMSTPRTYPSWFMCTFAELNKKHSFSNATIASIQAQHTLIQICLGHPISWLVAYNHNKFASGSFQLSEFIEHFGYTTITRIGFSHHSWVIIFIILIPRPENFFQSGVTHLELAHWITRSGWFGEGIRYLSQNYNSGNIFENGHIHNATQ